MSEEFGVDGGPEELVAGLGVVFHNLAVAALSELDLLDHVWPDGGDLAWMPGPDLVATGFDADSAEWQMARAAQAAVSGWHLSQLLATQLLSIEVSLDAYEEL